MGLEWLIFACDFFIFYLETCCYYYLNFNGKFVLKLNVHCFVFFDFFVVNAFF